MQVRVRRGVFALALVVALALVAGSASARERIRTAVTIGAGESPTGREFLTGRVKSPAAKCERRRNVVLYFDAPGPPREFEAVADDLSNSTGRWRINAPKTEIPPGHYFVKVTPIQRGGDKCKGARSETITVIGI